MFTLACFEHLALKIFTAGLKQPLGRPRAFRQYYYVICAAHYPASFRFRLTADTLAFGYRFPLPGTLGTFTL